MRRCNAFGSSPSRRWHPARHRCILAGQRRPTADPAAPVMSPLLRTPRPPGSRCLLFAVSGLRSSPQYPERSRYLELQMDPSRARDRKGRLPAVPETSGAKPAARLAPFGAFAPQFPARHKLQSRDSRLVSSLTFWFDRGGSTMSAAALSAGRMDALASTSSRPGRGSLQVNSHPPAAVPWPDASRPARPGRKGRARGPGTCFGPICFEWHRLMRQGPLATPWRRPKRGGSCSSIGPGHAGASRGLPPPPSCA